MWIVLIIAMILILLVLLVQGVIGMASSSVLSLKEFFFNTAWGIIALISGVASVFFFYVSSKMPKKIRESKTRVRAITPVLEYNSYNKSNNQNANTHLQRSNIMNDELQEQKHKNEIQEKVNEKVIDMEVLTLEGFFKDVAFTLNKPTPVIFKAWGNKRFRLDVERLQIFSSYIQNVRGVADEYLKMRADIFFSKDKFEHYVKANKMKAEGDLDLIEEDYKDILWNKKYNRRLKEAELKDREIAQKERLALIDEQAARTEFFKTAIKEYPEMPAPLKAYMFTQVHGRYPEAKRDFDLEDKITEYIIKKHNIDISNMEYDSNKKKEEAKTFAEKMKNEREKYK